MNTIYLSAAALVVAVAIIFLFMVLQMIKAGKRGDKVDDANAAAPEGLVPAFYLDPEEDRGDRK